MAINKRFSSKAKTDDIKYEVLEECGSLATRPNGDTVKLRYLSWNDREPKYDLRIWSENDDGSERCGKGVGLSGEELEELHNLIGRLMED